MLNEHLAYIAHATSCRCGGLTILLEAPREGLCLHLARPNLVHPQKKITHHATKSSKWTDTSRVPCCSFGSRTKCNVQQLSKHSRVRQTGCIVQGHSQAPPESEVKSKKVAVTPVTLGGLGCDLVQSIVFVSHGYTRMTADGTIQSVHHGVLSRRQASAAMCVCTCAKKLYAAPPKCM